MIDEYYDTPIIITGSTGFIGSRLTSKLVKKRSKVHAIIRPKSDTKLLKYLKTKITIHIHKGSAKNLCEIIAEVKPTIVFHLASRFEAEHKSKDITPIITTNILFSTQLLDAMAQSGVKKLVNVGTSWQYYENKEYSPVNLYAATKQALEAIIQYYIETAGLTAITLTLYDTFGNDDPRNKLIPLLIKTAQHKNSLAMSPGEQLIDLVHVDDVTEAFMISGKMLLSNQVTGHEHYAVTSGKPISIKDLVTIFERTTSVKLPIQWGARAYRKREVMIPWSLGKTLPNWRPSGDLEQQLKQLFTYHTKRPND